MWDFGYLSHMQARERIQDFLKGGSCVYIKVWGFALLILSHFLKYPMKMK